MVLVYTLAFVLLALSAQCYRRQPNTEPTDAELQERFPKFMQKQLAEGDVKIVDAGDDARQRFQDLFSATLTATKFPAAPHTHQVLRAWKVENRKLLKAYEQKKDDIRRELSTIFVDGDHPAFWNDTDALSEWQQQELSEAGVRSSRYDAQILDDSVGEHVQFHGTVAEDDVLASILDSGLNVYGNNGALGAAIYMAGPEAAYEYSKCDAATKWRFTLVMRTALGFPVAVSQFGSRYGKNVPVNEALTYGKHLSTLGKCCKQFTSCSDCVRHGCVFCPDGVKRGVVDRLFKSSARCYPADAGKECPVEWVHPTKIDACPKENDSPAEQLNGSKPRPTSQLFAKGLRERDIKQHLALVNGKLNEGSLELALLQCYNVVPHSVVNRDTGRHLYHYLQYDSSQHYIDYVILHNDFMPKHLNEMSWPDSFRNCY